MTPQKQMLVVMSLTGLTPVHIAEMVPLPHKRVTEVLSGWPLRKRQADLLLAFTRRIVGAATGIAHARFEQEPYASSPSFREFVTELDGLYADLFGEVWGPDDGEQP